MPAAAQSLFMNPSILVTRGLAKARRTLHREAVVRSNAANAANATPCDLPATQARWLLVTSALMMASYWGSNTLTSLRQSVGSGVFEWEAAIPFVPWSIVPYLSIAVFFALSFFVDSDAVQRRRHVLRLMIVLGVSLICYALFPLRFSFDRPETSGLPGALFEALSAFDRPFNRAPSLHISVLVVLWVRLSPPLSRLRRIVLTAWFWLIALSVLTTYQHHVIDVPAGLVLGGVATLLASPAARRRAARAMRRCVAVGASR